MNRPRIVRGQASSCSATRSSQTRQTRRLWWWAARYYSVSGRPPSYLWRALAAAAVLTIVLPARAAESASSAAPQSLGWLEGLISRHGFGFGLLAVFIGGLALNLTPCVYPMIPVTLAFFTNQAAGSTAKTARLAFLYILGISCNYALLGVVAAKTGALFGSWLQQPVVLLLVAAVIVALALSLFGFYDLRLPSALTQRFGQASAGGWGAFAMGLVVGLIAAPCIGPFVLGLLFLVGRLGNPVMGFFLFFVLGLGMGLPYLVLALAAHRIGRLPKAGEWLLWCKKALGVILLGLALWFLRSLLAGRLFQMLVSFLLIASGVYLGWIERSRGRGVAFLWFKRMVGTLVACAGIVLLWPGRPTAASPRVAWAPYSETAFQAAVREHRPVVVDVYADWCIPCVEMDHTTFRNPSVVQALGGVATLRVNATDEVSADAQKLLERYQIYGAPTVLFFDRAGKERSDVRLSGFSTPKEFLDRLKRIL